jgi:hypothetical protein
MNTTATKIMPQPWNPAHVDALVAAGLSPARARVLLNLASKAAGVDCGAPHTAAAESAVTAGLVSARSFNHYVGTRVGRNYSLTLAGERLVRNALAPLGNLSIRYPATY